MRDRKKTDSLWVLIYGGGHEIINAGTLVQPFDQTTMVGADVFAYLRYCQCRGIMRHLLKARDTVFDLNPS